MQKARIISACKNVKKTEWEPFIQRRGIYLDKVLSAFYTVDIYLILMQLK